MVAKAKEQETIQRIDKRGCGVGPSLMYTDKFVWIESRVLFGLKLACCTVCSCQKQSPSNLLTIS